MFSLIRLPFSSLAACIRSRAALAAEILALRHQLLVCERAGHARLLAEFRDWYNQDRVHLALSKDAPGHRSLEPPELGKVVAFPRLGGMHHRYSRRAA